MPKIMFITIGILVIGICLIFSTIFIENVFLFKFVFLIMCLTLLIDIVLLILFLIKKELETVKTFQRSYRLELLEKQNKNLYAIIDFSENKWPKYIFAYKDEYGRRKLCREENVKIEYTYGKPFVEIYTKEYTPKKGFLEFLFYTEEIYKNSETVYILYINDDMIKALDHVNIYKYI